MIGPRLFYLASELRKPIPSTLSPYLPQAEVLQHLANFGSQGVSLGLSIPEEQIQNLIKEGSAEGPASEREWRFLISNLIEQNLAEAKDAGTLPFEPYLSLMKLLEMFYTGQTSLIEKVEGDFTSENAEAIPKWNSGFEPFDILMRGFYQGTFIIMGAPGSGKTSVMVSLAEGLRATNAAASIWLYQMEIPRGLFEYRIKPVTQRTEFIPGKDRIFYGFTPVQEMISMCQDDPDPERVIFFDSPDVLAEADDKRRLNLEQIFRELVILKQLVKGIFVASQPRRQDRIMTQASVSESWGKAWFADGIIGIQLLGQDPSGRSQMRCSSLKNRFGPNGLSLPYQYNLITLEATVGNQAVSSRGFSEDDADGW